VGSPYREFSHYALIGLLTGGLLLGLTACAIAPAGLKRQAPKAQDTELAALLRDAIAEPPTPTSRRSLALFIECWKEERQSATEGEVVLTQPDGTSERVRVRFSHPSHDGFPLDYFDSIAPAEDYVVKNLPHYKREGVGSPLVAIRENLERDPIEKYYPPEAITSAVTAVVMENHRHGSGRRDVEISLVCPLAVDSVKVNGKRQELAADFSVPWAALISRGGKLNQSKILDALRLQPRRHPQLYMMEPYDPRKEPLIMIHGLLSTPLLWSQLSNELWADDEIRKRYQIWHFLYNTSAPALYSGRILQRQLHELREMLDPDGNDQAMKSTTIIAHSMGGIVTRRLTTDPQERFWDAAFTQPIDSLDLSDDDRKTLERAFYWKPERHIRRIIYVAVPHRGSRFADNLIGKIGQLLVRPPKIFSSFYNRISSANPGAFTDDYNALGQGKMDSVNALSPQQPTLKILPQIPDAYPISTHSIIGNRGRRGPLSESSDGIVEYWSSHLPNADSEKVVPTDHNAVNHPDSLAEIKRLLKSS